MAKRVAHLARQCETTPAYNYYGPTVYTFMMDVKHHLYGCFPLKSASTAMRLWWWQLWHQNQPKAKFFENVDWNEPLKRHIVNNKALLRILRQGSQTERILLVRHPAIRFWSAWNQKFLKEPEQKIGQYICQATRLADECEMSMKNTSETHLAKFGSFANEFAASNCARSIGDCNALGVWNEHWGRQADMCQVCGTNFTLVFKAETLEHDMAELTRRHPHLNHTFGCVAAAPSGTLKSTQSAVQLIKRIYAEVSVETRQAIFDFYRDDFRLFAYGWNTTTNEIAY